MKLDVIDVTSTIEFMFPWWDTFLKYKLYAYDICCVRPVRICTAAVHSGGKLLKIKYKLLTRKPLKVQGLLIRFYTCYVEILYFVKLLKYLNL